METIVTTSPHHVRSKLLKHKAAYVESVGRSDMATLSKVADADGGSGTVLRLIMGATERMPLRALGYIDSALRIAQILPFEQLQIVHANNLGSRVNGLSLEKARQQSRLLAEVAAMMIGTSAPGLQTKVLHAEDTPLDLTSFLPLAKDVLSSDAGLNEALSRKGQKHGGEHEVYTAAHCAFQDTDQLRLNALIEGVVTAPQVVADRIVSIGCQQERTFYLARMAMRRLIQDIDLVDSAQIFTNHVSPPYFLARGGEPALEDVLARGFEIGQVGDPAASRDINHLVAVLGGEGVLL